MKFPNIVLVGARGSGKSRASRILAAAVGWQRVSADERFEAAHGPIPEFVERSGWAAFREREAEILRQIAETLPPLSILDCGGGVLEHAGSRTLLHRIGTVYWIRAPLARLEARVARKPGRPSLTGENPAAELGEILRRRTPFYRAAAEADVWSSDDEEAAAALRHAHFGPGIALSVAAADPVAALREIGRAEEQAGPLDLIELRADRLTEKDLGETLEVLGASVRNRLIVTVRTQAEGGHFAGSDEEREHLLLRAARAGVRLVDVESLSGTRIRLEAPKAGILASRHRIKGPLPDLEKLADELAKEANAIKVAIPARGFSDVRRVFDFLRDTPPDGVPRIGIALGPAGTGLRVTGGPRHWIATFAPPPGSPGTAPGQLDAAAIRGGHRRWGKRLIAPVPVYGVVGWPVTASLSPPMHEAAFVETGSEASYQRFETPPEELEEFLTACRLWEVAGLNVTFPLKERVIPLLDSLDETAHRIGAVNTILRVDDRLVGTNTDWLGAARALLEVTPLAGKRVHVLGAGGSARAVLHGLQEHGARAVVIARDTRRAEAVAARFGASFLPARELAGASGDVLINATPVGMAPNEDQSPVPREALGHHRVVFDLVYNPRRTRLLREAEAEGAVAVNGLPMLIHQAAASFAHWTGTSAEDVVEVMRKAATRLDRAG